MIELLVTAILVFSAIILILLLRISGKLEKTALDPEAVKGAVATSWKELGVDQDIGAIKQK